ncbi:TraB/GumN family protein [Lacinutrix sp. Bg11-31]|uniref:TraB/GumN family protein n=1 Tax=Lacinutrix sp. Bg11-31 TaxID=2057808 RepID=UPI000C309C52|nr:TraB/GumN family protein [Lacinutrix sp. Bg11-31]AUC82817.1 TraB/GumN family protein [Lacinutrix sp. Bg11-31]
MHKHLIILATFFCFLGFSQEQEQSLLWEISGNGLQKSSYIYGTMHVSKKVAFRLDDVFFDALEKSETIALESDPSTWLNHSYETAILSPQNSNGNYRDGFYSSKFSLKHPNELLIRSAIRQDNRMLNGYLYRKSSRSDNFEEETYLDMFIYQAGKKKNKPIVSLENLDEAEYLTTKASTNAYKKKIDPWLTEIYEKESPYLLQENTYRERNLALLDSIGEASNTQYFRENMLYIRNDNMVTVLDSIMQNQTVFAGVGAAHLPGERGMLKSLRDKGYTVKTLLSEQTQNGQTKKQSIEDFIAPPVLKKHTTADGFLTIKSFSDLKDFFYNGQKFSISPDMTNGAFVTISRFNLFDFLPSEDEITLDRLENFLFEDIPGDIISKEKITTPFPGLSILNKTKKDDYQKYHIYKTPLEIIIIKFGGPKNYVLNYEKEVFESINFKMPSKTIEIFKSPYGKYEVLLPKFNTQDNLKNAGNKLIQANIGDDFYFLKESVNQDTFYIEEDEFEAKYITESFFKDLKIENSVSGNFNNGTYKSYEAVAKFDSVSDREIHLKTIVKDGSYYLLGYSGKEQKKATAFFNSFKFNKTKHNGFEKKTDTSLHFTVLTNTKPVISNYNRYNKKKKKDYEAQTKQASYYSKANEQVFVIRTKFHDLQMYTNIDSLWQELDDSRLPKYKSNDDRPFNIENKKKTKKDDTYTYSYTLSDSLSVKAIKVKHIVKKGVLFTIKSLNDSKNKPSPFITNFYETFKPIDTIMGETIFKDKTQLFFEALKKDDSIVMNTYDLLKFNKSHSNTIMDLVKNFEFPENKENIKTNLISELIELDDTKVLPFLKDLYVDSYSNPKIQTTILKALLNKKNKKYHKDVLVLMQKDLPIEQYAVQSLFYTYKDSLELKKYLFPKLLEYTNVQEYKEPIYNLLARLKDSSIIKPKVYKKYKKSIINDGKIEIKRSLSKKSVYSSRNNTLYSYVKLIFPFRKESAAKAFFDKLLDSENAKALTTYYALLENAKEEIPVKLKNKTIDDYRNQAVLVNTLYALNLKKPYLTQEITQLKYAKSYLFSNVKIETGRDSISFLVKKPFKTDSDKKGTIYFFKLDTKNDYGDSKKLFYAAFLDHKKQKELVTNVYYQSGYNGNYMDENEKEDELIEEVLDLVKYKTRKRISER